MSSVSKTSTQVQVRPCAYCKEVGHFMRASRDPNSAITCPLLKEKENRRKAYERRERRNKVLPVEPCPTKPQLNSVQTNLFSAFDDNDSEDETLPLPKPTLMRSKNVCIDFPELPTLRNLSSCQVNSEDGSILRNDAKIFPEKTYASVAIPLAEEPVVAADSIGMVTPVKNYIRVSKAPGAPMKPVAPMPAQRSAIMRKRWVDYDTESSSDEEDEGDVPMVAEQEQWCVVRAGQSIPVGNDEW
jgi:hypothetical protein